MSFIGCGFGCQLSGEPAFEEASLVGDSGLISSLLEARYAKGQPFGLNPAKR